MSNGEKVQCCNPECNAWRYLYSEVTVFPWGSAYCKGECADMAREFRIKIKASTAQVLARVRKDYAVRRM
jgi:hypothetical protein